MRAALKKPHLFFLFPVFLILYEFCTNMSNDMYLPAIPQIASDFRSAINLVQLTITAWLAGDTAVQLFVGPLSDRYGRRPVLFGGGALFLISSLACSLAQSLEFLIAMRFLQGIGVCTMMVTGYASIHDLYDDKKAIHILVWMGSAAVLAPAIGPLFGGLLLLVTGWRMIFFALFVLALIALFALWFIMPESTTEESRKSLNVRGVISSYGKILSNSHFMISAASFGLLYGGIMGWITTSPYILMETLQLSSAEFGTMQIPIFGAYIVGAQLVKILMKKLSSDSLITLGLAISAIMGVILVLSSFAIPGHLFSYIAPMTLYALGFGFAAAPLNRITLTSTHEPKGTAMAVFYLTMIGSGTLISFILSIFSVTVLLSCSVIGAAPVLGFFLNSIRKNKQLST